MTVAEFDEIKQFIPEKVAVIDTETTGLSQENNEVLSLSIVDYNGNVLFDHLIKPQQRVRWPNAQKVHSISPADVKDEKTLLEYADELKQFFDGSYLVIGYNVQFDIGMLKASGLKIKGFKTFDVMKESKKMNGQQLKLTECAQAFGYGSFDAHGSLEDAKATAFCFRRLFEDSGYRRIKELESAGMSTQDARIAVAQSSSGCLIPLTIMTSIPVLAIVLAMAL